MPNNLNPICAMLVKGLAYSKTLSKPLGYRKLLPIRIKPNGFKGSCMAATQNPQSCLQKPGERHMVDGLEQQDPGLEKNKGFKV